MSQNPVTFVTMIQITEEGVDSVAKGSLMGWDTNGLAWVKPAGHWDSTKNTYVSFPWMRHQKYDHPEREKDA